MILFRRLKYCVHHMRTEHTLDPYTGRFTSHRVRIGNPEWRERKYIHIFLEDGADSMGRRWKTICGRFHHEDHPGLFPPAEIERGIEYFMKDTYKCATCLAWLQKHKEGLLTAARLT